MGILVITQVSEIFFTPTVSKKIYCIVLVIWWEMHKLYKQKGGPCKKNAHGNGIHVQNGTKGIEIALVTATFYSLNFGFV